MKLSHPRKQPADNRFCLWCTPAFHLYPTGTQHHANGLALPLSRARSRVLGKKGELDKLNWNGAVGVPHFPFHKPSHLFRCLECSPWTELASPWTLHGWGRTGWVGWVGGEGGRCSHLAFTPTAPGGAGVGRKLEELHSPYGRKWLLGRSRVRPWSFPSGAAAEEKHPPFLGKFCLRTPAPHPHGCRALYENTDSKAPPSEWLIQQVWGGGPRTFASNTVTGCCWCHWSESTPWESLELSRGMDKLTCHVGKLRTEGQQMAVFKDLLADPLGAVWDGEADKWTTD